jgi:uncharacterized protein YjiS (DUF1127 family)
MTMTYACDANSFDANTRRGAVLGASFLSGLVESIARHSAERRAARALLNMDDYLLRDIGISREEIRNLVHTGRVDRDALERPRHAEAGSR